MRNYFYDWTTFEKWLLGVFTVLGVYLSYTWGESPIGLISLLTGLWCVILVSKGKISNYYFGLVNVVAYGWIAYNRQLYGEVLLNWGYFIPAQIWGLVLWLRIKNRRDFDITTVKAKSLTAAGYVWVIGAIVLGIAALNEILKRFGGNLPGLDSTTTILQVVAMILMALRYKEQWALWILVNVFSITMWCKVLFVQGHNDISALMMWTAYLINSVYGFYKWNKRSKEPEKSLLQKAGEALAS